MRIVVTGATGNIGTAVLRALGEDGSHELVGLARRSPVWNPSGVRWVEADVATDDLAPALEGADAVVHLAWAFQPTHDPLRTWEVNARGTARVLEAAGRAGVGAVVHASSVGAYSPGPKDRGVDESWPTDGLPTVAYGREKAYAERLLDTFECRHPDTRVVRLRPGFVFQEQASLEQWRIFAGRLVPAALGGRLPVIPRTEGLRFQVVHAEDVAAAFRLAVVTPARGAFNVATDPPVGPEELAEAFGARIVPVDRRLVRAAVATGWHLRLVPTSPHLLDLALSVPVMDVTRAREELGWVPVHDARATLHALVEGLRHHGHAPTPPLHG